MEYCCHVFVGALTCYLDIPMVFVSLDPLALVILWLMVNLCFRGIILEDVHLSLILEGLFVIRIGYMILSKIFIWGNFTRSCERNISIAQPDPYFYQGGNKKGEHFVVLKTLSKNLNQRFY